MQRVDRAALVAVEGADGRARRQHVVDGRARVAGRRLGLRGREPRRGRVQERVGDQEAVPVRFGEIAAFLWGVCYGPC